MKAHRRGGHAQPDPGPAAIRPQAAWQGLSPDPNPRKHVHIHPRQHAAAAWLPPLQFTEAQARSLLE